MDKKMEMDLFIDADRAAAELCRRSLSFFVQEFWDIIIEDDLEWSGHMQVMCEEVQAVYEKVFRKEIKDYDLIINIPPGTSKSTICTIMAPAWSWIRDPTIRHITGSYSDSLSTEHAVKSRDIIRSDKYQRYFPVVQIKRDEDNKTNYKTIYNGQRYATSVGGTVTGVHAHVITIDDPLNPKQAASDVELESASQWLDKTLSTRKVDKRITPTILIMQRLHVKDPTGHLLEKKKEIRHICLPGTIGSNVKPDDYKRIYIDGYLDPVRLGPKVLSELKIDLGSDGYAGQIDQTPVQEGGLIWKKWFLPIDDAIFPSLQDMTGVGTDWDTAYTKNDKNSGSAFVTSGKIDKKMFIDNLGAVYMEFPELIHFMKHQRSPAYIEAKASGKSAKQTLVKNGIPAIEVKIPGGTDKIARAKMASPFAEAGMIYIRKSLLDFLYHDSRQSILNFPKGTHSDLADVLAQAIHRIFKGGILTGVPKEESVLDGL